MEHVGTSSKCFMYLMFLISMGIQKLQARPYIGPYSKSPLYVNIAAGFFFY